VPLLVAKTTLIRAKVTGTPGTINEVVRREVKGVKIEVEVAKDVAIGAKMSHVRTKSKRTILKTSY
jgi:spore germination cell wall hydrolase CwlJ-like protein